MLSNSSYSSEDQITLGNKR